MKRYALYSSNKEFTEFLDSKANVSDFLVNLVEDFRTGKLNYSQGDIDLEIKKVRLKKLTAEAKIKTWEADHIETFGKTPSYSAEKAIKERASNEKSFRELTEDEINLIVKHITLENTFEGYRITCKHCQNRVNYENRLEALHDGARHLSAVHGQKILKV